MEFQYLLLQLFGRVGLLPLFDDKGGNILNDGEVAETDGGRRENGDDYNQGLVSN
jgi:hypothetical protein